MQQRIPLLFLVSLALPILHSADAPAAGSSVQPQPATVASTTPAKHPPEEVKPEPSVVLPLWSGEPPNLVADARPETFVDNLYRNVSVPQLMVYLPPKDKANGMSLIICPGGGYGLLAMRTHVERVVKMLNEKGITVFGLKYRTNYGKNDVVADALADSKRAVRLVRSRADEWCLDPHRVGVQGYSAGSNLCLNLMSHFDDGDKQSADPIERFSSRPDFCVLMCPWPNKKTIEDFPIGCTAPPTWIAIARDDAVATFPFSEAIDEKLATQGVPHELFIVDKGGHGAFDYMMAKGPDTQWPKPLLAWLDTIGISPGKSSKP